MWFLKKNPNRGDYRCIFRGTLCEYVRYTIIEEKCAIAVDKTAGYSIISKAERGLLLYGLSFVDDQSGSG